MTVRALGEAFAMISRNILWAFFLIVVIAGVLLVYRGGEKRAPAHPIGAKLQIATPLGLPPVPIPQDNPPTVETVALGRKLYYDAILSVDNSVACASCHHPDYGFADG